MTKEIAVFKTAAESINVEVLFEDETVWLTQDQMAALFEKSKSTINEHIKNVFSEGELEEALVTTKPKNYYNLDVIISVGYRENLFAELNSDSGPQNALMNISAKVLQW